MTCERCSGTGQVSDMMTASIRTDTIPPQIDCPDCAIGKEVLIEIDSNEVSGEINSIVEFMYFRCEGLDRISGTRKRISQLIAMGLLFGSMTAEQNPEAIKMILQCVADWSSAVRHHPAEPPKKDS